ncbi:hypothetical protein PSTG_17358, partial [Puccinia striiformis f. sp. tritici PST-78]
KLLIAEFGEISEETGYGEVVRIVCVKVLKSSIGCREELEEQGVGPFLKGYQPRIGPKLATAVRLEMALGRSPPRPYIPKGLPSKEVYGSRRLTTPIENPLCIVDGKILLN